MSRNAGAILDQRVSVARALARLRAPRPRATCPPMRRAPRARRVLRSKPARSGRRGGRREDGENVVAVLALRLRHVHLEPVVEVAERLGPVAVVDEPVEGREERDTVGNRGVVDLGMRPPPLARSRTPSARKRFAAKARSAVAQRELLDSGYQRSARSHSRASPGVRRPPPRRGVEDLEHRRHVPVRPTSGASRRASLPSGPQLAREHGPARSSSRRM